MVVLAIVYQALAQSRIVSLGIVTDLFQVRGEMAEEPATDAAAVEQATPDSESRSQGRVLEAIEGVWEAVLPAAWPSPTRRLHTRDGFRDFLVFIVVGFVVLAFLLSVLYYFREYLAQKLVIDMLIDVRLALFRHLARQNVAWFSARRMGDLLSRTTNDVDTIQRSLRYVYETLFFQPFNILFALILAYKSRPFLFLIAVPMYALVMLPAFLAGKKVRRHGRGRQEKMGRITESLGQLFGGIRTVKAFGLEERERHSFRQVNQGFERSFLKLRRARIKARSMQEAIYMFILAILLGVGAWVLLSAERTGDEVSLYAIFFAALFSIYNPIKAVTRAWQEVQECRPSIERILEILRSEPKIRDAPDAIPFEGLEREIRFEAVSFRYDADEEGTAVLEDLSLCVERGESVALVGASGSGKSTLVDLVARFHDPQVGRVCVDDVDIRRFLRASYLSEIAIVSQDPFLFNATIAENIRYGREDASDDEIVAAARAANAHEFILEQPEGYNTVIGDRGAKLSGGQRQRLTIARAFVKNASIWILDEATSALDNESEREVQVAIDNILTTTTAFVVAHRLSTITGCDRICVLDAGRIVESGTHAELLARGEVYAQMWRAQSGGAGDTAARETADDASDADPAERQGPLEVE